MKHLYMLTPRFKEVRNSLLDGHISYGFGSKAKLDADPKKIFKIDCSGFARYFLYQATDKEIIMPDGSWNQLDWCKRQGFEAVNYSTAASCDSWLRIAFFMKNNTRPGHVWFIRSGLTLESHGKTTGPNQRMWDTKVLKDNVSHCFKLALLTEVAMCPAYVPQTADACFCD